MSGYARLIYNGHLEINYKLKNTTLNKTKINNVYEYYQNSYNPTSKCVTYFKPGIGIIQSISEFGDTLTIILTDKQKQKLGL